MTESITTRECTNTSSRFTEKPSPRIRNKSRASDTTSTRSMNECSRTGGSTSTSSRNSGNPRIRKYQTTDRTSTTSCEQTSI